MARPTAPAHIVHVDKMIGEERRRSHILVWVGLAVTAIVGAMGYTTAPDAFSLAILVLLIACVAALVRPAMGVYLIVFFSLVGDAETMPWWPFTKNLSSRESILYVSDVISITPLELLLGMTFVSFMVRPIADSTWRFRRGRLFWPIIAFTFFVIAGFARGLVTGGDLTIALFEVRPLLYIPLLYVLITNLMLTRRQLRRLMWCAVAAVSIQSIFSLGYYRALPTAERAMLESLSEHTASVQMNAVFVFLAALVLFKATSRSKWLVGVLALPAAYAYLLSQRRAGMVALFIGLAVLIILLFRRDRRLFWIVTPSIVVLAVMFILATWNAQGVIGLPSTAVKTVLFPDELTTQDRDSNLYRQLEAFNLWFTIRDDPLRGRGFGQKFLVVVNMPDISFFEEWQYLPHNSVLWIWIKTGYFGFVAMLFLFGRALMVGTRSALRVASPGDAAIVASGLAYVLMFLVFAYVDIAWDIRPAVFLSMAFALCADFERLDDDTSVTLASTPRQVLRPVGV